MKTQKTIKKNPSDAGSMVISPTLSKIYNKVCRLNIRDQNRIAKKLKIEIDNLKWNEEMEKDADKLDKIGREAIERFKKGNGIIAGWDEV